MDEPIDVDELRRRVVDYRQNRRLSLRAAAEESGVPLNTLARVEKGHLPDLANFTRLVTWVGSDPAEFFRAQQRMRLRGTTEVIRASLHSDPNLSEQAAAQIADLVNNLYATLATPAADVNVHLRAHATFTPGASRQIGNILERMRDCLLADDGLGSEPGWI